MTIDQKIHSDTLPKSLGAFFWYFIMKQPVALIFFFIAPIALILESNLIPYALKMLVDGVTTYQHEQENIFQHVAPALWLGGISWLVMITIIRLQNWWQGYVIPRFEAQIRMATFDYLSQHSFYYFSNQFAGSLANKVSDLTRSIEAIRSIICWNVIVAAAAVVAGLILMSTINIVFPAILLLWVIIQCVISFYFARNVNELSRINAEDKSELSGKIVDILGNISAVKLFSRRRDEINYVGQTQEKEMASNKRLIIYTNVFRLCLDIPVSLMLIVTVYALIHYWQLGAISTGDVVYIIYASFAIMNVMWYLSNLLAELFREIGIAKQALEIITAPIEIKDAPDAKALVVSAGLIEFDDVTFHYSEGKKIFNNKSIVIKPKQKVGLVGYSGGGKSTFINLILRFFDLESGTISIDHQDISQVTQDSLRAAISVIPQEATLFHRSLKDNIRYGDLTATDDEVYAASIAAHCHEFIESLPEGYDALVGERGIKLSGGQRQRIAIARAILKDAPILILDEATSQLDSVTEEFIQEGLLKLMNEKTTLVIAHRLSTLLHMDRILVFDDGVVVADGSHQELLQQGGLYKTMWEAQIGGFLPGDRPH